MLGTGAFVTVYDRFDKFYKGKEANIIGASSDPKFRLIDGDILEYDKLKSAMKGSDVVFHEAGQAGVGYSLEHPRETSLVNVSGTLNVLGAARENRVKRVVNASSSSIFGEPKYLPIDEVHPTNPTSPYGVSKLVAEQYASVFSRLYGTYVVSLRYFSVYGPRGRPDQVIHRFAKAISEGKRPVIQGDGTHSRDFTYVSDVVEATVKAAESEGLAGESFNIGFGKRTTITELAERLIGIMGAVGKLSPEYVEGSLADFPHTEADNRKAKKLLGWEPHVGLDQGLRSFLASLRTGPGGTEDV